MNERSGLLRNLLRDVNKILVQKSKEKHTRMPTVTKKFGIILTKKKASETPLLLLQQIFREAKNYGILNYFEKSNSWVLNSACIRWSLGSPEENRKRKAETIPSFPICMTAWPGYWESRNTASSSLKRKNTLHRSTTKLVPHLKNVSVTTRRTWKKTDTPCFLYR